MSLLTGLFFFVAVIAIVLLIQGVVTLVSVWIVIGRRPALGDVIKAIVLSLLVYVVVTIGGFQFHLKSGLGFGADMGLGLLVLLAVVLLPLLVSCYVFARCLDITMLQAFAANLLTWAIFATIGYFSTPYLPLDQLGPPKGTQLTATPLLPQAPAAGA